MSQFWGPLQSVIVSLKVKVRQDDDVLYVGAPAVKPFLQSFWCCFLAESIIWHTLHLSRTGDRALLASNLSTDPEAGIGGLALELVRLPESSRHQSDKRMQQNGVYLLVSCPRPVALGSDDLRRLVIYSPSMEHEHLRPGFRNHNDSHGSS